MERERESKDKDKRRTKYFDPPDQIPEPTPRGQRQARGPAKEGKEMEMESFGETELGDMWDRVMPLKKQVLLHVQDRTWKRRQSLWDRVIPLLNQVLRIQQRYCILSVYHD